MKLKKRLMMRTSRWPTDSRHLDLNVHVFGIGKIHWRSVGEGAIKDDTGVGCSNLLCISACLNTNCLPLLLCRVGGMAHWETEQTNMSPIF